MPDQPEEKPGLDLFAAFNNSESKDGEPTRRRSLGAVAKENAIVRRRNSGVGADGLIDNKRDDEVSEAMRPGEHYRPFF